jgi:hypothetical protein
MVASRPTTDTSCSNLSKNKLGEPGQNCVQPTFTVTNGEPVGSGGASADVAPALTSQEATAAAPSHPATQLDLGDRNSARPHTVN